MLRDGPFEPSGRSEVTSALIEGSGYRFNAVHDKLGYRTASSFWEYEMPLPGGGKFSKSSKFAYDFGWVARDENIGNGIYFRETSSVSNMDSSLLGRLSHNDMMTLSKPTEMILHFKYDTPRGGFITNTLVRIDPINVDLRVNTKDVFNRPSWRVWNIEHNWGVSFNGNQMWLDELEVDYSENGPRDAKMEIEYSTNVNVGVIMQDGRYPDFTVGVNGEIDFAAVVKRHRGVTYHFTLTCPWALTGEVGSVSVKGNGYSYRADNRQIVKGENTLSYPPLEMKYSVGIGRYNQLMDGNITITSAEESGSGSLFAGANFGINRNGANARYTVTHHGADLHAGHFSSNLQDRFNWRAALNHQSRG